MTTEFLACLRDSKFKRIPLDEVRRIFFKVRPELANSPTRNLELLNTLKALEQQEVIQLPAISSWEKIGNPPFPKWIQLVRENRQSPKSDYADVPWVPELGFWTTLRPQALESAKAINAFLLQRRGNLRLVPIKERSLEIFGDEKRLDSMRSGDTLFGGRLPLSAIGAFQTPLPLPYRQADAPGRPVLILENHNSFWSFGQWNHKVRYYSAVVYGAGEAFRSSGAALGQVLLEVDGTGAEYLGDLDPKGVQIPIDFNRAASPEDIRVEPAVIFYRWLLTHGIKNSLQGEREIPDTLGTEWLGPELGNLLLMLWAEGYRIPQESLGLEALFDSKNPILV